VPRRLALAVAVIVGGGLAIAGAFLISPFHEAAAESPKQPPGPSRVVQSPAPAAPMLTDAQEQAARTAVATSPALSALVRAPGVSMLIVTWRSDAGDPLGTGVDIRWTKPRFVSGTWPAMAYDHTETITPPYQVTTARVRARGVTGVHAAIDLNGKIVDVQPLSGQVLEYSVDMNTIHLPPQPKGLD
jgi:hypothetical protein